MDTMSSNEFSIKFCPPHFVGQKSNLLAKKSTKRNLYFNCGADVRRECGLKKIHVLLGVANVTKRMRVLLSGAGVTKKGAGLIVRCGFEKRCGSGAGAGAARGCGCGCGMGAGVDFFAPRGLVFGRD